MDKYPEDFHDELESYPLRLNVAALPDRRFFKMTRTLTVGTVLLAALLIVLGVWLNYQLTHLDVTVRRNGVWQFYRVDPVDKRLEVVQSAEIKLDPLQLVVEERLREYLKLRHSTVWNEFELAERFKPKGLIAQMSSPEVLMAVGPESKAMIAQTRGAELVRDVHIYDLQVVSTRVNQTTGLPLYLWTALVEFFDLPLTDEGEAMCACTDNSKACLACKIQNAKQRERRRIWIRTSLKKRGMCEATYKDNKELWKELCQDNPWGISVDKYIQTHVPIRSDASYWDLPPALLPDL